jgi:hypothetical protein
MFSAIKKESGEQKQQTCSIEKGRNKKKPPLEGPFTVSRPLFDNRSDHFNLFEKFETKNC